MMNETPVVAYPVNSPNRLNNNMMDDNVYSSSIGDSKFADDTIEMSGNFFSQLDSMIAAVKVESSALDSMKEKLREVENLRNQISNFTKRLLDADQANLNLKTNLVKTQEMLAEAKKTKAEVESTIVPLRAELNRTKDQCNKERQGRIAAQQQIAQMKDNIAMLENAHENLDREVKTIPALVESNEILKNDLAQLRRRYKDEKTQMTKHIKTLEGQARDVETIKGCVRDLSMKLLDLANTGTVPVGMSMSGVSSSMNLSSGAGGVSGMNNSNTGAASSYLSQQQQQQMRYQPQGQQQQQQPVRYGNGAPQQQMQMQQQQQQGAAGSNVYYQYGFNGGAPGNSNAPQQQHTQQHGSATDDEEENDYEDADNEDEEGSGEYEIDATPRGGADVNNSHEYDNEAFAEVNSSLESVGSLVHTKPAPATSAKTTGTGSGGKKKKVVRRTAGNVGSNANRAQAQASGAQNPQRAQPRMMQQLDGNPNMNSALNNNMNMQYQQPQQYRSASNGNNNMNSQQQQGMSQSFSLPRI